MRQVPSVFDLVIFDCDGVLVDSEALSCGCLAATLQEHGYGIGLEEVLERFLGRSFKVVEEHCDAVLGRPLPPDFSDLFRRRLRDHFVRGLRPMAGIGAVLGRMSAPRCVASSSDRERLAFSLELTNLAWHFGDRVYSSDMVAHGKPAPDLFLYAAGQTGAQPSRALVIEDSVNGVRAGLAAGMTVWGFVGGSHHAGRAAAEALSAAGAQRILAAFADFPAL